MLRLEVLLKNEVPQKVAKGALRTRVHLVAEEQKQTKTLMEVEIAWQ